MKIGVVGTGNIGGTLARKLRAAGHDVRVANSRGLEGVRTFADEIGARAVDTRGAVNGSDQDPDSAKRGSLKRRWQPRSWGPFLSSSFGMNKLTSISRSQNSLHFTWGAKLLSHNIFTAVC
jgi:hypothetical protein